MYLKDLPTPSVILDLDSFENNIRRFHDLAKNNGKEIWPMVKTHKSKEILQIQKDAGATGVLCGTLDECEAAAEIGFDSIMYAYPVSDSHAIERVIKLTKNNNFIIRIDDIRAAELISNQAKEAGVVIKYTAIVDSGLHRFGIPKEKMVEFVKEANDYDGIKFVGVSTHPGHVYSATKHSEVQKYVEDEINTMDFIKKELDENGIEYELLTSGSTPTFLEAVKANSIGVFHPGNYIFLDAIQMSLNVATDEDCALRVLASVLSNPREGEFITDAGAKCLGLDKGAHGNASIIGHGKVVGHEDVIIESLSEEVGKMKADEKEFKVSDRIQIIPNHSCSVANLTDYIYAYRGDKVERVIEVDVRGNSKKIEIA